MHVDFVFQWQVLGDFKPSCIFLALLFDIRLMTSEISPDIKLVTGQRIFVLRKTYYVNSS